MEEELPLYQCHKTVWALKIAAICPPQGDSVKWRLKPTKRFISRCVTAEYIERHKPVVGGYWVQYEDGYQSFSPARAFEDGYTLVQ